MDKERMALIGDRAKRIEIVLEEFDRLEQKYQDFESCLRILIASLLDGVEVNVHNVTSRTKDRNSFLKKISKPGKLYASLSEVTDVCGIRVTTYFENGIDSVKEVIESEFLIDKENSVDKRKLHDPDRFGYMSLHYVLSLKPDRNALPEYKKFQGMKAEVQIRSILQHTWAEIEHDLGYKSKVTIPANLQRRFSQLSSLLELADREFLDIRMKMIGYEKEVLECLKEDENEYLVDKISIKILSQHHGSILERDQEICSITGARLRLSEDFIEVVVEMLRSIGIERLFDLMVKFRLHEDKLRKFADGWISQRSYEEFNNGISLMYLVYILLGQHSTVDEINKFAAKYRRGGHVENFGERLKQVSASIFIDDI